MSTIAIIAIVIGALILLAIIVAAAKRSKDRRELGRVQTEAIGDDVSHHREQAQEQRTEAAVAEERAKRKAAEADAEEQRAASRERELSE